MARLETRSVQCFVVRGATQTPSSARDVGQRGQSRQTSSSAARSGRSGDGGSGGSGGGGGTDVLSSEKSIPSSRSSRLVSMTNTNTYLRQTPAHGQSHRFFSLEFLIRCSSSKFQESAAYINYMTTNFDTFHPVLDGLVVSGRVQFLRNKMRRTSMMKRVLKFKNGYLVHFVP